MLSAAVCVARCAARPASSGGPLPFLIFLGVCLWVGMQFRPTKRSVWASRWSLTLPLLTHIGKDVEATARMLYVHVYRVWRRLDIKKAAKFTTDSLDDELRRLLGD